jgi:hypothetical protein
VSEPPGASNQAQGNQLCLHHPDPSGSVIMITRSIVILILAVSVIVPYSALSPPIKPAKEEGQKERSELRKKIKETLDAGISEVSSVRSADTKAFFQVRIACLLWNYDEKGARALIDEAQGLTASVMNDPKINIYRSYFETSIWEERLDLRRDLISMIAQRDPEAALEFLRRTKLVTPQGSMQSGQAKSFDG